MSREDAETREGLMEMDGAQSIAILLVAATSFWVFITLKKRIDFLEHEVRWLRSELNDIKLMDSDSQEA
jgi:Tfp pilus assembly protein PilN